MLYVLILTGAALTAFLLQRRLQRGAYINRGILDAPKDQRAAAKRLGYQAQPNVHPIRSVSDANLCITALATAFAGMDEYASQARHDAMDLSLRKHLKLTIDVARDMQTFAPWLVAQGGGSSLAFERLTKHLKQLDHGPYFAKLMSVLGDVAAAGSRGMPSAQQADSLGALARIFRTA